MAVLGMFYVLTLLLIHQVASQHEGDDVVPKIDGSFRAYGDIRVSLPNEGTSVLSGFEENYSVEKQRASLTLVTYGNPSSYLDIFDLGKTYVYNRTTPGGPLECKEFTAQNWKDSHVPPDLKIYELNKDQPVFPLHQLLQLDRKYLITTVPEHDMFRKVPAFSWTYHMNSTSGGLNEGSHVYIRASYSREDWTTTTAAQMAPLGFEIIRNSTKDRLSVTFQTVNIMNFVRDQPNLGALQMMTGIVCAGYRGSVEFPNLAGYSAFFYSLELVKPSGEILNSDTWVDADTRKMRTILDLARDEGPDRKTYDIIVNPKHGSGIVYTKKWSRGNQVDCNVTSLAEFDLYDPQILFDVKSDDYSAAGILGSMHTHYVLLGQRYKRGLPTRTWQGVRQDWPPRTSGIPTLWELDIVFSENVKLPDNDLPLISSQVTFMQDEPNTKFGPMKKGMNLTYNFYNVQTGDPKLVELTSFDISSCYKDDNKELLQIQVDFPNKDVTKEQIGDLVTNLNFLAKWKSTLTVSSGLDASSLRVSQVTGMLSGNTTLYILFILLGKHPSWPQAFNAEPTLTDAISNLASNIKNVAVKFSIKIGDNEVSVGAVPDSLRQPYLIVVPEPQGMARDTPAITASASYSSRQRIQQEKEIPVPSFLRRDNIRQPRRKPESATIHKKNNNRVRRSKF